MALFSFFKESSNSFEGQEVGEKVVYLIRRHPFFITVKFIFLLFAFLIPLGLAVSFSPFLYSYSLIAPAIFLLSLWLLIIWQLFFYMLTMYTLDVWIVTDRRIIDSTQHGFFSRTISELHVSRVQDISVHINGPIQTFLRFGNLQIQTAGTEDRFKFIQIPNPEEVKNEIMRLAGMKNPLGHL